jgi:hypothetical protein
MSLFKRGAQNSPRAMVKLLRTKPLSATVLLLQTGSEAPLATLFCCLKRAGRWRSRLLDSLQIRKHDIQPLCLDGSVVWGSLLTFQAFISSNEIGYLSSAHTQPLVLPCGIAHPTWVHNSSFLVSLSPRSVWFLVFFGLVSSPHTPTSILGFEPGLLLARQAFYHLSHTVISLGAAARFYLPLDSPVPSNINSWKHFYGTSSEPGSTLQGHPVILMDKKAVRQRNVQAYI